MRSHLRWRIEMIQPPPPNIRLYHAALGLSFALFLCIFVKYPLYVIYSLSPLLLSSSLTFPRFFLPFTPTEWAPTPNFRNFRNFKMSIFVFFAGIPTDEILWSAACVLPVLAKVACGRGSGEKDERGESLGERDDANAAVNRRLGYPNDK